jgi:hypothetical protein
MSVLIEAIRLWEMIFRGILIPIFDNVKPVPTSPDARLSLKEDNEWSFSLSFCHSSPPYPTLLLHPTAFLWLSLYRYAVLSLNDAASRTLTGAATGSRQPA